MEDTGVPVENHCLTSSHWQRPHMPRPGFEPRQWWETARSQWRRLRPHGRQSRPLLLSLTMIRVNDLLRCSISFTNTISYKCYIITAVIRYLLPSTDRESWWCIKKGKYSNWLLLTIYPLSATKFGISGILIPICQFSVEPPHHHTWCLPQSGCCIICDLDLIIGATIVSFVSWR